VSEAPNPAAGGGADQAEASSPAKAAATKPPAKPAKPPAPEEQPFASFVPELLIPALSKEIQAYGGPAPNLSFQQAPMPVIGTPCWMVVGVLPGERRFWLCFTEESLTAPKVVIVAEAGAEPSLVESFLIDERKITLALLVSRLVQRLNGQKWLGAN
jgi:hypothetical protein